MLSTPPLHASDVAQRLPKPSLQRFRGEHVIVQDNGFVDGPFPALELPPKIDDLVDGDRRPRNGFQDIQLAPFNLLCNLHLPLPGEQGDRSHLPQVEPNRVVGLVQHARGQVQTGLLVGFSFKAELLRAGRFGVAVDDLNALGAKHGKHLVKLFRGGDVPGKQIVDLVIEQVTLLLAQVDQLLDLVVLVLEADTEVALEVFNGVVFFHVGHDHPFSHSSAGRPRQP